MTVATKKQSIASRWKSLKWEWRIGCHEDGWVGEYIRRPGYYWRAGTVLLPTLEQVVDLAEALEAENVL